MQRSLQQKRRETSISGRVTLDKFSCNLCRDKFAKQVAGKIANCKGSVSLGNVSCRLVSQGTKITVATIGAKSRTWFYFVQRLLQRKQCKTCSFQGILGPVRFGSCEVRRLNWALHWEFVCSLRKHPRACFVLRAHIIAWSQHLFSVCSPRKIMSNNVSSFAMALFTVSQLPNERQCLC